MSVRFFVAAVIGCIVLVSTLSCVQTYRECRHYYNLPRSFCATVVFR